MTEGLTELQEFLQEPFERRMIMEIPQAPDKGVLIWTTTLPQMAAFYRQEKSWHAVKGWHDGLNPHDIPANARTSILTVPSRAEEAGIELPTMHELLNASILTRHLRATAFGMTFYERVSGLEERERLVREIEAWRPRLTTPQAYAQFLEEISVYYKNVRWDVLSEEALQALY